MNFTITYQRPFSDAVLDIGQQASPEEIRIDNHIVSPSSLPRLAIKFDLRAHKRCFSKGSGERFAVDVTCRKSFCSELYPSVYLSYDVFYRAMRQEFDGLGDAFDPNYRHDVVEDVIGRVDEIVHYEPNKGRQSLNLFVRLVSTTDERAALLEEESASKPSVLQLLNGMEVDENIIKDHCAICLEEHGEERDLQCMPCSHMFHGDCITTWLEHGHSCPICRYDFLKS